MNLKLDKPLVVLDSETTNDDPKTARIFQFGYVKLEKGRPVLEKVFLINPTEPISPEATAVHGYTDGLVKDRPTFDHFADEIMADLQGCDLGGFNHEKFDIPILTREFAQCEIEFPAPDCRFVDAMKIYHRNEKRDLKAAVRLYLGCEHDDAHDALEDATATAKVLCEQVERYGLPEDIQGLHDYCHEKPENYVDQDGKFQWRDGEAVVAFSKQKGRTLKDLAQNDQGFLNWILRNDFSDEVKEIARNALNGEFPRKG